MTVETVTIGGIPLAYEKEGEGPPLVFFHGGNSSAVQWEAIVPQFMGEYTCYALEQRGHGRSGRAPDADYRLAALIDETTAFMETVTGPAVVVGQSQGGIVAMGAAVSRPGLVRGIYLEDSVPGIYGGDRHRALPILKFFRALEAVAEAKERERPSVVQHAYNIGQLSLGGPRLADVWPPFILSFFARCSYLTDPRWYQLVSSGESGLSGEYVAALPGRLQCPVHVAHGDVPLGSLVTEDDVRELAAAGVDLTSTHFPGAGHSIQPTFARELVADLRAFLARVS